MTKMTVEVPPVPLMTGTELESNPANYLVTDSTTSSLLPSKKIVYPSKNRSVSGKRKRTVRDRRTSETIDEERDKRETSEKDDMEFSGELLYI